MFGAVGGPTDPPAEVAESGGSMRVVGVRVWKRVDVAGFGRGRDGVMAECARAGQLWRAAV